MRELNYKYPNLELLRLANGLTVQALLKEISVKPETYNKWLHIGQIPQRQLEKLADFYGVSADFILNN